MALMVGLFLVPSIASAGLLVAQQRRGADTGAPTVDFETVRARSRFAALLDTLVPPVAVQAPDSRTAAIAPMVAPTAIAAPTATAVPTPTVSPTTTATPGEQAAMLLARVSRVPAMATGGELQASLDYRSGAATTVTVRFDLGDSGHPPSIDIMATYHGSQNQIGLEAIVIGEEGWIRQGDGPWAAVRHPKSVRELLRPFLFDANAAIDPHIRQMATSQVLQWLDGSNHIACELTVDPASGMPGEWRAVARDSGKVLTVAYGAWRAIPAVRPDPASVTAAVVPDMTIDMLWTL